MLTVIGSVVAVMIVMAAAIFNPLRSEFEQWRGERRVSNAMRRGVSSLGDAPVRVPRNFTWQYESNG